jgi:hypothetical protein
MHTKAYKCPSEASHGGSGGTGPPGKKAYEGIRKSDHHHQVRAKRATGRLGGVLGKKAVRRHKRAYEGK